jgi:hypothetical protein
MDYIINIYLINLTVIKESEHFFSTDFRTYSIKPIFLSDLRMASLCFSINSLYP